MTRAVIRCEALVAVGVAVRVKLRPAVWTSLPNCALWVSPEAQAHVEVGLAAMRQGRPIVLGNLEQVEYLARRAAAKMKRMPGGASPLAISYRGAQALITTLHGSSTLTALT